MEIKCPMTLDEAIKHARDVAKEQCERCEIAENKKCGDEHVQLAEWLEELKSLRLLHSFTGGNSSNRLISVDAAIDAVLNLNAEHRVSWKDAVIDMLDNLPSEKSQWIQTSERLPKENTEVFVYLFDRPSPYIAWVRDSKWHTEEFEVDKDDEPVEWMPLPKRTEDLYGGQS